ncbi:MAG: uracil phosphoribosyltransferase [Candidatus Kerfeldbacteria bacterium]|nr:uracil phosphoribosyltransferase [Candidatus Kerfeldbacteria bacterium]
MQIFSHDDVDAFNGAYPENMCAWDDYCRAADRVTVVEHPILADVIRVLRDRRTLPAKFRRYTRTACQALLWEATRTLPLSRERTPSVHGLRDNPLLTPTQKLTSDSVDWAVILRAGDAFKDPALRLLPKSRVATYGIKRNDETLEPELYKRSLPPEIVGREVCIVDPMFATGGSALYVVSDLKHEGVKRITLVCIFASAPGILRLKAAHPDVRIVTAALDPILNARGYIVPGCGDFGDRYNGTESIEEDVLAA